MARRGREAVGMVLLLLVLVLLLLAHEKDCFDFDFNLNFDVDVDENVAVCSSINMRSHPFTSGEFESMTCIA